MNQKIRLNREQIRGIFSLLIRKSRHDEGMYMSPDYCDAVEMLTRSLRWFVPGLDDIRPADSDYLIWRIRLGQEALEKDLPVRALGHAWRGLRRRPFSAALFTIAAQASQALGGTQAAYYLFDHACWINPRWTPARDGRKALASAVAD